MSKTTSHSWHLSKKKIHVETSRFFLATSFHLNQTPCFCFIAITVFSFVSVPSNGHSRKSFSSISLYTRGLCPNKYLTEDYLFKTTDIFVQIILKVCASSLLSPLCSDFCMRKYSYSAVNGEFFYLKIIWTSLNFSNECFESCFGVQHSYSKIIPIYQILKVIKFFYPVSFL